MSRFLFTILTLVITISGFSQTNQEGNARTIKVKLLDGTTLSGTFDRMTSDTLYFEHGILGMQKVPQSQVKEFSFVHPGTSEDAEEFPEVSTEGFYRKYGFGKLNHNRYALIPHGYGPEKGEVFFRSTMLYYNNFEFGVSDRVSMDFGTLAFILPTISVKYHGKLGYNTYVGLKAGILLLPGGSFSDGSSGTPVDVASYASAGLSLGEQGKNLTAGVGVAIANGIAVPTYNIGANFDFNSSVSLTFEMPYIGAGITGNNSDLFLPVLMPKVYSKRSMWGIGVTYPLLYDRVAENWEDSFFFPVFVYNVRLGPIGQGK